MINQESPPLHCAACGSQDLSPETRCNDSYGGPLTLFFQGVPGIIFEGPNVTARRARICGQCGFVMFFLEKTELSKIQKNWEKLQSRN